MKRFPLAVLALLAALPAWASLRGTLVAPRDGTVLRGGARAEIAWAAQELPTWAEEWEAFLSVDGGAYYAYRITPHLELDTKRFTFDVPNVETANARILIRAGNEEEDEFSIELPSTFAIRRDGALALAQPQTEVVDAERGEPARRGEPGVIAWIDGDRRGAHLEKRDALEHPLTCTAAPRRPSLGETLEESDPLPFVPAIPAAQAITLDTPRAPRRPIAARQGREVLLAYSRLNI